MLFLLTFFSPDSKRDFYEILGLPHDCTDRQIERSFQHLSRINHPDKNKGDPRAAEIFTNINDAYGALRDPLKRRIFDLWGEVGVHTYDTYQTNKMCAFVDCIEYFFGISPAGNVF